MVVATATTLGQSVGDEPPSPSYRQRSEEDVHIPEPESLFIMHRSILNSNLKTQTRFKGYPCDVRDQRRRAPISGLGPITAESTNHATYKRAPFINESGTYTAYASVTLLQPPQIDLPTMRSMPTILFLRMGITGRNQTIPGGYARGSTIPIGRSNPECWFGG